MRKLYSELGEAAKENGWPMVLGLAVLTVLAMAAAVGGIMYAVSVGYVALGWTSFAQGMSAGLMAYFISGWLMRGVAALLDKKRAELSVQIAQIQDPVNAELATELAIRIKGLNAPRVKPEDITANIAHTEYVTYVSKGGQVLRWAVLTTQSGYAVVGKPSVAVSPENDDEIIGRQVAYDNSRNEMWPLMGYALKERLSTAVVA